MEPILNKKYIKNAIKKAKNILHNGGTGYALALTTLTLGYPRQIFRAKEGVSGRVIGR